MPKHPVALASFLLLALSLAGAVWTARSSPAFPFGDAEQSSGQSNRVTLPEKLSPEPPTESEFKEGPGVTNQDGLPFLADFAWKDFIALNWPALEVDASGVARRGLADKNKKLGMPSANVVWGTWKAMDEQFPPNAETRPPSAWDEYESTRSVRHPGGLAEARVDIPNATGRTKLLSQLSKIEDINQGGFGLQSMARPLIAQNRTYVRYEVRGNRHQYDYIRKHHLYLRAELNKATAPIPLPVQSIIVKAAWKELTSDDKTPERFYHVPATTLNWNADGSVKPEPKEVALVGFHIVHRTPARNNWIWITFEHIDNTELGAGGKSPPSFNSLDAGMAWLDPRFKKDTPSVKAGQPLPPPGDPRMTPVEVGRYVRPYDATLEGVNQLYWNHPEIKCTVWKNYRLVGVQWPVAPGNVAGQQFPEENVANAVLDTYTQMFTCLECHAPGFAANDFLFYIQKHAVPRSGTELTRKQIADRLANAAKSKESESGRKRSGNRQKPD